MIGNSDAVVIVGGGWAGLAAAISLCKMGKQVELYESAKQTGGRARCAPFDSDKVDNGQHLMIGAYHCMQQLMSDIGLDTSQLFARYPVDLQLYEADGKFTRFASSHLPAPFHLVGGLFRSKGISLTEYISIMRFMLKYRAHNFILNKDKTVSELISEQPQSIIKKLWEPLCIAALNTPIQQASANIFLQVLKESFMQDSKDSDLLIPATDLGSLFPQPAIDFIEQHGGKVHLGRRVTALGVNKNKIEHIVIDGEQYPLKNLILATPLQQTFKLLDGHDALSNIASRLVRIKTQPICTVYLRYPPHIRLDFPMIGMLDTTTQWVFDRRVCGQAGIMAVVISADGPHMQLDKQTLAQLVSDELARLFPDWPEPLESLVIREKRATFSADVDINDLRPRYRTSIDNLWLAGDYTATGYPATLEGAMRSGVQCAEMLLQQDPHNV